MQITKIKFPVVDDFHGKKISYEEQIPFDIKRVYYMFGMSNNVRRGKHAHKTLQQVLVCIQGSCNIFFDNGFNETTTIELNRPDEGLLILPRIWHEMFNFNSNAKKSFAKQFFNDRIINTVLRGGGAILLVFASDFYDESDYIRKYEDFLKFIRKD